MTLLYKRIWWYVVHSPRHLAARALNHRAIISRDLNGHRMLLDARNHIDRGFLRNGGYEIRNIDRLIRQCRKTGVTLFLDVGANIGAYTIAFAKAGLGLKQIIAFEPDPRNLHQLAANLWLNELDDRVEIRREALSDHSRQRMFYVDRRERQRATGLARFTLDQPGMSAVTVQCRRLDDILSIRGETIAIKMDVEGHERHVLAGMENLCRANQVLLQVELHEDSYDATSAQLADMGFRLISQPVSGKRNYWFSNAGSSVHEEAVTRIAS